MVGDREIVTAGSRAASATRRCESAATACRARSWRWVCARATASATLAWNTQHHLEIYYGAMGAGLVCHTLNPRLTVAHLAAMVNEAEDRVLAVGAGPRDAGARARAALPEHRS